MFGHLVGPQLQPRYKSEIKESNSLGFWWGYSKPGVHTFSKNVGATLKS